MYKSVQTISLLVGHSVVVGKIPNETQYLLTGGCFFLSKYWHRRKILKLSYTYLTRCLYIYYIIRQNIFQYLRCRS